MTDVLVALRCSLQEVERLVDDQDGIVDDRARQNDEP
jgi:hypothetical protein